MLNLQLEINLKLKVEVVEENDSYIVLVNGEKKIFNLEPTIFQIKKFAEETCIKEDFDYNEFLEVIDSMEDGHEEIKDEKNSFKSIGTIKGYFTEEVSVEGVGHRRHYNSNGDDLGVFDDEGNFMEL